MYIFQYIYIYVYVNIYRVYGVDLEPLFRNMDGGFWIYNHQQSSESMSKSSDDSTLGTPVDSKLRLHNYNTMQTWFTGDRLMLT